MVDGITVRPAVQRTADRRIKREADQASAGSAGFVLIAFWRDRKAAPLSQIGTAANRAKPIKNQQSKTKTIKNPAHGKRGRGF
jgi:hypothetical protein